MENPNIISTFLVLAITIQFLFANVFAQNHTNKIKFREYKNITVTDRVTAKQVHTLEWEKAIVKPKQKTLIHVWEHLLQNHQRVKSIAILKALSKDGKSPRPAESLKRTFTASELVFNVKGLRNIDEIWIDGFNSNGEKINTEKLTIDGERRVYLRNPNAWGAEKAIDKVEIYAVSKTEFYHDLQYHTELQSSANVPGLKIRSKDHGIKGRLKRTQTLECNPNIKNELGDLNTQILEVSTPIKGFSEDEKILSEMSKDDQKKMMTVMSQLDAAKTQYSEEEEKPSDNYLNDEDRKKLAQDIETLKSIQEKIDELKPQIEELKTRDPNSFKTDEMKETHEKLKTKLELLNKKVAVEVAKLQEDIKKIEEKNTKISNDNVRMYLKPKDLKILEKNDAIIKLIQEKIIPIQSTTESIKNENPQLWAVIENNTYIKEPPPSDSAFLFDVSNSMRGNPYNGMIFTVEYALNLVKPGSKFTAGHMTKDKIMSLEKNWKNDFMYKNIAREDVDLTGIYDRLKGEYKGNGFDGIHHGLKNILDHTTAKDVYIFGDGAWNYFGDYNESVTKGFWKTGLSDIIESAKIKKVKIHIICVNCDTNTTIFELSEETGGTFSKVDTKTLNPKLARANLKEVNKNFDKISEMERKIAELKLEIEAPQKESDAIKGKAETIRTQKLETNNLEIGKLQAKINELSGKIDILIRSDKLDAMTAVGLKDSAIQDKEKEVIVQELKQSEVENQKSELNKKAEDEKTKSLEKAKDKIDSKRSEIEEMKKQALNPKNSKKKKGP